MKKENLNPLQIATPKDLKKVKEKPMDKSTSRAAKIIKSFGEGVEAVAAINFEIAKLKLPMDDIKLLNDMASGARSISSQETKKAMGILDKIKAATKYTIDGFGLNDVAAATKRYLK